MIHLLCLLLILSPLKPSCPDIGIGRQFHQVCTALELCGPREMFSSTDGWGRPVPFSFRERVTVARSLYRELRYAPALAEAQFLPDKDASLRMEGFLLECIGHMERQQALFGYRRFDDSLEQFGECRRWWKNARVAADDRYSWSERRRALAWLEEACSP